MDHMDLGSPALVGFECLRLQENVRRQNQKIQDAQLEVSWPIGIIGTRWAITKCR